MAQRLWSLSRQGTWSRRCVANRARTRRADSTGETVHLTGLGMPVLRGDGSDGRDGEARGDLIVEMKMRSAAEEAAYLASRIGGAAVATLLAKAALLRLPAMAGGMVEVVFTSAAVVLDFLSTDVLGRARPEARADRMRRGAEQRLLRYINAKRDINATGTLS